MSDNKDSKIVIEGVTEEGQIFRPSDWAERVSGSLSTFRNHRIYYSPLLKPVIQNEKKCVVLDKSLKDSNPTLYEHILDFARKNRLRICGEDENEGAICVPSMQNSTETSTETDNKKS